VLATLFAFSAAVSAAAAVTPDADGFKSMSSQGFIFKWRVSGDKIDCVVRSSTKGWLAVGFNGSKAMNGANIIIGYVDKDGIVKIEDDVAKGHSHKADKVQNVENKFGSEQHGVTELRFTIPLNSGDEEDFVLIPGQTYYVILALGAKDAFTGIHAKKTGIVITL